MNSFYLKLFELLSFLIFSITLIHAISAGQKKTLFLLGSFVFGVILEIITLWHLRCYFYPQYSLMFFNVPVWIGAIWSVIIYTSYNFSEQLTASPLIRSFCDGLIALSLDLSIDAIAIRLGLWHWGVPLTFDYFGVPFPNFWAWFFLVFCFTYTYRTLQFKLKNNTTQWLLLPSSITLTLIAVGISNEIITYWVSPKINHWIIFSTIGTITCISIQKTKIFTNTASHPFTAFFYLSAHIFFLSAGIISGVIFRPPILLFLSLSMLAIHLFLYRSSLKYGVQLLVNFINTHE